MAVKIKLKRMGKIRAPHYRIIVADARNKRDGRAIEEIGKYHPKQEPSYIQVDSDRVQYWLSVGAQPTNPVLRILQLTGDWQKFKGEPASSRLQEPKPKPDKEALYQAAVKELMGEAPAGAATEQKSRSKKSTAKSEGAKSAGETKSEGAKGKDTKAKETKSKGTKAKADAESPATQTEADQKSDSEA